MTAVFSHARPVALLGKNLRGMFQALYPCEKVVLLFGLLAIGLSLYLGIPLRRPLRLYAEKVSSGFTWYLAGLVICLFLQRLRDIQRVLRSQESFSWGQTLKRFVADYLRIPSLIRDLRLVHAIGVTFVVFINLKHLVPFINGRIYDLQFAAGERWFFGGKLAAELCIDTLGMQTAKVWSDVYLLFYPYLVLAIFSLILQRRESLAQSFCAGFSLVWFLGILVVYLLPTLGPCFSWPELFSALPLTRMHLLQQDLWQQRLFVEKHPFDSAGVSLISGFPSLHIAAACFGSLFLRQVHWLLAMFSWGFVVLTAISTLYFGWHFILDDIGGIALALGVCWGITRRYRG